METSEEWMAHINDPKNGASLWIRQGLKSALKRDPVEALNDAETLVHVLKMRWDEMQETGRFK